VRHNGGMVAHDRAHGGFGDLDSLGGQQPGQLATPSHLFGRGVLGCDSLHELLVAHLLG